MYTVHVLMCFLVFGSPVSFGQRTGAPPLIRPVPRTFRPPIFQPPVQTTTSYEVNASKPLWDTAVEVEDLACGQTSFCNKSLAQYPGEHCFTCSRFVCKCDEICHVYGDCCVDIALAQSEESPGISHAPGKNHMECQRQSPKQNKDEAPKYIIMVSRCPENTSSDKQIVTKCEQPDRNNYEEATPVSDLSSSLVYRNSFCAHCFGVEQYKVWSYKIECQVGSLAEKARSKEELWRAVLNDTKCSVSSSPPEGTSTEDIRNCIPDTEGQCNATGGWREYNLVTEQLCESYYDPVVTYDDRKTYKNVFCAMCNGAVVSRKKLCFAFSRSAVRPNIGHGFSRPLSVLIDFNAEPVQLPSFSDVENSCERGTIFNPISESCFPLMCSHRRILTDDDQCKPRYKSAQGLGYAFSLLVTPSRDLFLNTTLDLPSVYREGLVKSFNRFQPISVSPLEFQSYTTSKITKGNQLLVSDINVQGKMVSKADVSITDMEQSLRDLDKLLATFNANGEEIPLETRFVQCPEADEMLIGKNAIPSASTALLTRPLNFPNCFDGTCLDGVEYLPAHGILECPHIEIDLLLSNVTYNHENSSMEIFNQTFSIDPLSHYVCGSSLKLCASVVYDLEIIRPSNNATIQEIPENTEDFVMTIVSVVCIALSLLCLFMTFIIYCIIPQLRTLPGKNTMALIFHLFCAQLFFQVGIQFTYDRDLCRAMGVIIHYFWLTAFAWMAISAYHMCAVFSSLAASRFGNRAGERRTLVRYIVLSNVFAAVFILSCVIYHLVSSKGSEIGYGGHICFLNQPFDIGIFFAVPVALVLVFNVICFVKTVMSIKNVPDMKSAKNKPNKNHVHVYFRLSILLGFTWVFGFVAAIIRMNVWWYVFIVLNGLQGVFIFVAYCLNKRTLRQLKSRVCLKRGIKYSRPSKTSSSDRTTHSTSL